MTPSEQRGYDDQMAGRIDADLFCGDRPDAICYRNGARTARRELAARNDPDKLKVVFQPNTICLNMDQALKVHEELRRDLPSPLPIGSVCYTTRGDPVTTELKIANLASTPNAFADPQPGKRRRKPKADVADSEQLGLL